MTRNQIVLTAMAAGGHRASFNPVQMQKCLFLINREIPDWITVGDDLRMAMTSY